MLLDSSEQPLLTLTRSCTQTLPLSDLVNDSVDYSGEPVKAISTPVIDSLPDLEYGCLELGANVNFWDIIGHIHTSHEVKANELY